MGSSIGGMGFFFLKLSVISVEGIVETLDGSNWCQLVGIIMIPAFVWVVRLYVKSTEDRIKELRQLAQSQRQMRERLEERIDV